MSASHGCIDDKAVVEKFKEALKERIGADRFRMWFSHGVQVMMRPLADGDVGGAESGIASLSGGCVVIAVSGQFALERLRQNFLQPIRAAAAQACGSSMSVSLELGRPEATQAALPLEPEKSVDETDSSTSTRSGSEHRSRRKANSPTLQRGKTQPLATLLSNGNAKTGRPKTRKATAADNEQALPLFESSNDSGRNDSGRNDLGRNDSRGREASAANDTDDSSCVAKTPTELMTLRSFVAGSCNKLAHTAVLMACQNPRAATPLFLYGPSGIGKTHLIHAIADQFRSLHRMRRVVTLSGEKFTNEFCKSVGSSGLPAFRKRYRDVDALLVDDVQFLSSKSATLREMLYTVESLIEAGRPIIFTANQSPSEINGLSSELAGRMASGLVCPMHTLDTETRQTILDRLIQQRCSIAWPEAMVKEISSQLAGDGRVIGGVVNLVATLQKMLGRMATIDEIRQFGGDLLRASQPSVTLSTIERVVCEVFGLPAEDLRSNSQSRVVCEPRMLAMYLSRQLTSAAFSQIAGHYGGRSHSTAIAAEKNVKKWLNEGKSIGRGRTAISAREAIDRLESLLRTG